MYFIGIDQSYNSTGLVIIDDMDQLIDHQIITSDKSNDIHKRANQIINQLSQEIIKYPKSKIAIEGLAYSMRGNATRDLAGLQFIIINHIRFELNKNIQIISPPGLKKFATGNGRASKDDMIKSLSKYYYKTFTQYYKKSNGLTDITDAYYLASFICQNS